MSKVIIMTDTVSCIPKDIAAKYKIHIVPAANIIIDGKSYIDGVTITAEEAYGYIQKDPDRFLTTAITPDYLLDEYRKLGPEPKNVLFITLSSALSAVGKTAELAANLLKKENPHVNIHILDSKACAGSEGLLTIHASKEALEGGSIDHIIESTNKARKSIHGLMLLDTLRYIYRTGRMSKTAARIVSFLNIRPINRMAEDGTIQLVEKVRKREAGLTKLLSLIQKEAGTDTLHFHVSHANAAEIANNFSEQLKKQYNCLSLIISDYSPVMGYGAGPGCIFVAFHPEIKA